MWPHLQAMKTLFAPPQTAVILARLLERLDASRQPVDAHQYRVVASRLSALLADPDVDWQPLLAQSPATAALYENLHYAAAGLCRSPLAAAVPAEQLARQAIEAAAQQRASDPGQPDIDQPAEDQP